MLNDFSLSRIVYWESGSPEVEARRIAQENQFDEGEGDIGAKSKEQGLKIIYILNI